ncbi:MAG: preprotein translocase subunit SecB [Bacteroidales bacterium]|nr:protein-export chaperone SecB [Labilibaculum sp.]PCH69883.1 MAG: preprotein translocase subunit SecB [Bacteroidales bacterium]
MKIQLEGWKVQSLDFKMKDEHKKGNDSFQLKVGQLFPNDNKRTFVILFDIALESNVFNLNFEAAFSFSVENDITEEFISSNFPKINAPAIAFPYIRAYISNLTLQSGFKPVILPSINFVKLSKEQDI